MFRDRCKDVQRDGQRDGQTTDGHQAHRYISRSIRSGDKNIKKFSIFQAHRSIEC